MTLYFFYSSFLTASWLATSWLFSSSSGLFPCCCCCLLGRSSRFLSPPLGAPLPPALFSSVVKLTVVSWTPPLRSTATSAETSEEP